MFNPFLKQDENPKASTPEKKLSKKLRYIFLLEILIGLSIIALMVAGVKLFLFN